MSDPRHEMLKDDEAQIRLVKFLPTTAASDSLSLETRDFPIKNAPSYEALSYVWGSVASKVTIECDGRATNVTPNLYVFLKSIHQFRNIAYFWVDALCIDMTGSQAKQTAISMMPLMYEKAACTLCWIGVESPSPLRTLIAMTCRSQDFETMVSGSFSSADIYHSTQRIRDRHLRHAGTVLPGIDPITCARVDQFLNEMYCKRQVRHITSIVHWPIHGL
jgi:hypothetical protein